MSLIIVALLVVGIAAVAIEVYMVGYRRGDLRPETAEVNGPVPAVNLPVRVSPPLVGREIPKVNGERWVAYRSRRHHGAVVGRLVKIDRQERHVIAVRDRRGKEFTVRRRTVAEAHIV